MQHRLQPRPELVSIDPRLTESFSGTVIRPQHQTATQRRRQEKVVNKTKKKEGLRKTERGESYVCIIMGRKGKSVGKRAAYVPNALLIFQPYS